MNINDIVAAKVEAARRKAAADKARRAEQQQAREFGLQQRHRQKLRNLKETELPHRITCCPRCAVERVHRRVGGTHVQGQPHDVLRCSHGPCRLLWLLPAEPPPTGSVRPTVGPTARSAA